MIIKVIRFSAAHRVDDLCLEMPVGYRGNRVFNMAGCYCRWLLRATSVEMRTYWECAQMGEPLCSNDLTVGQHEALMDFLSTRLPVRLCGHWALGTYTTWWAQVVLQVCLCHFTQCICCSVCFLTRVPFELQWVIRMNHEHADLIRFRPAFRLHETSHSGKQNLQEFMCSEEEAL